MERSFIAIVILMMVWVMTACTDKSDSYTKEDDIRTEITKEHAGEEDTEEEDSIIMDGELDISFEGDVSSISNEKITWGVGKERNSENIPTEPLKLQEKYGNIYTVNWLMEDEPVIYLTFDEGYENGYTSKILDVLKEKNVKAVFFVTMPYAKKETVLVQRMIDEGHVVGGHSVTHPSGGMPSLSLGEQLDEVEILHQYMLENYGYRMWLFRPPAGTFSEQTLAVAQKCGYRTLQWSFAYADWDPNNTVSVERALDNAITKLHNGAIYLFHAVSATNADMLGSFIDQTIDNGYDFGDYRNIDK